MQLPWNNICIRTFFDLSISTSLHIISVILNDSGFGCDVPYLSISSTLLNEFIINIQTIFRQTIFHQHANHIKFEILSTFGLNTLLKKYCSWFIDSTRLVTMWPIWRPLSYAWIHYLEILSSHLIDYRFVKQNFSHIKTIIDTRFSIKDLNNFKYFIGFEIVMYS